MAVKIFILGRPGTGKSTAARSIKEYAQERGYNAYHINDYQILQHMFQEDTDHLKFRPIESNGFDVIDFSVLDTALKEVENEVRKRMSTRKKEIILIEFARNNYRKALKQFSSSFLRDAYFLFLDTDIETCIQRIHYRVAHPTTLDDHFISDEIIRDYYNMDNRLYMKFCLSKEYSVIKWVSVILNTGSRGNFIVEVKKFIDVIFKLEEPSACRKLSSRKFTKPEAATFQRTTTTEPKVATFEENTTPEHKSLPLVAANA